MRRVFPDEQTIATSSLPSITAITFAWPIYLLRKPALIDTRIRVSPFDFTTSCTQVIESTPTQLSMCCIIPQDSINTIALASSSGFALCLCNIYGDTVTIQLTTI